MAGKTPKHETKAKPAGRVLVSDVVVDGVWYGPSYGNADKVPGEIAERITNPAAWGE